MTFGVGVRRLLAAALVLFCLSAAGALAESAPPAGPQITKPEWAETPSSEDLAYAYPIAARDKGLEGRAVIECGVEPGGRLQDCGIVSETPKGEGFGAGALAMAWKFRMKPKTVDGVAVAGGAVRIPIRFTLAEDAVDRRAAKVAAVLFGVAGLVGLFAVIACVVVPIGLICHGLGVWPGWSALTLLPLANVVFLWALALKALAVRRARQDGGASPARLEF